MITQIIWLLSWPLLIAVSFFIVNWMVKSFEAKEKSLK
jgi:hypothetical protein